MRVLFSSTAGLAHMQPMVPLARALRDRGHDVLWATGSDGCAWLRPIGLRVTVAGATVAEEHDEYHRRWPEWATMSPLDLPAHAYPHLFGAVATPPRLAALHDVLRDFRADVVVHEVADFAGPIAAAQAGVRNVSHSLGRAVPRRRLAATAEMVAALWEEAGLQPSPLGGHADHLYIEVTPPSLQTDSLAYMGRVVPRRPESGDSRPGDTLTDAVRQLLRNPAPTLYVTFGVEPDPHPVVATVLAALGRVEARVVATLGQGADAALIAALPPNVIAESYLPQSLVLGHCAAVISHGGAGTVLAGLARGLPQLCLPSSADDFASAHAVVSVGAGILLHRPDATQAAVEHAVHQLLTQPSYRAAAARVRAEIAMMPSADEVAGVLELL